MNDTDLRSCLLSLLCCRRRGGAAGAARLAGQQPRCCGRLLDMLRAAARRLTIPQLLLGSSTNPRGRCQALPGIITTTPSPSTPRPCTSRNQPQALASWVAVVLTGGGVVVGEGTCHDFAPWATLQRGGLAVRPVHAGAGQVGFKDTQVGPQILWSGGRGRGGRCAAWHHKSWGIGRMCMQPDCGASAGPLHPPSPPPQPPRHQGTCQALAGWLVRASQLLSAATQPASQLGSSSSSRPGFGGRRSQPQTRC
jgi:hypothetical protein